MNEYRQNAINHLKTHLGCVGYRNYLIAELEKLDKIEQIVNSEVDPNICNNVGDVRKIQAIRQIVNNYDGSIPSMITQFSEIQKVLEQE